MTLVNRLIKEARAQPEFLDINRGQVRKIAAHAHSLMYVQKQTVEDIEQCILDGKMTLMGIPVRVV